MELTRMDRKKFSPICHFLTDTWIRVEAFPLKNKEINEFIREFFEKSQDLFGALSDEDEESAQNCLMELGETANITLKKVEEMGDLPDEIRLHLRFASDFILNLKRDVLH